MNHAWTHPATHRYVCKHCGLEKRNLAELQPGGHSVWRVEFWRGAALEAMRTLDDHVVSVPFNPTAENMAQFLVEVIGPLQLEVTGIELKRVRIEETAKCHAAYTL